MARDRASSAPQDEGVVTEQRNSELVDRQGDDDSAVHRPPSSSDLLDLVRSAEDEARLALRKRTPALAIQVVAADAAGEEVVDVGDEAIDAPPSLPPLHAATPAGAVTVQGRASRPSASRMPSATRASRSLSPAMAIALLLTLAVGVFVVLAR